MSQGPLTDEERRDWLRLARAENVGPVAFRYLIDTFGEPARAIGALPRMAERAGRALPPRVPSPAEAERELAAGAAIGARLLCSGEPAFPHPGHRFYFHWLYFATLLGLGGIWFFVFCAELKKRPLLPINDPFLAEAVAHE